MYGQSKNPEMLIRLCVRWMCRQVYVVRLCVNSEAVLSTRDVRWELVAVLTAVTTKVTLEWVSEAMASHVDGVHDVVQEQKLCSGRSGTPSILLPLRLAP